MNEYRVYSGNRGAVMNYNWEILEQWGEAAAPAEILEWAHEEALRLLAAHERTIKNYQAALAFAKAELGEKAEISRCFALGGQRAASLSDCAGSGEHTFRTFDVGGVTNPKYGQLATYSVKVGNFGECELVGWLA